MRSEDRAIIADADVRNGRRAGRIVFLLALLIGTAAALYYARLHLTLSHYDARAHLVVARRVMDSLTPGWRQLGAVWLPLPHLLNVMPVQMDWNFRTGFSAVAISILSLSWGLAALAQFLHRHTQSQTVAVVTPLLALLNPNVLYLQSTPMTEALLFGLSLAALLAIDDWIVVPHATQAHAGGLRLAALVLTRYEGWLIGVALVLLALMARPRERSAWLLILYPASAVIAFFCLSWLSSGVLLVTSGFFIPDNPAGRNVRLVIDQILTTTRAVTGPLLMGGAVAGAAAALLYWRRSLRRSLLPLALLAAVVLPLGAFYDGHPLRVRYLVPMVVACAALSGLGLVLVPARARALAAVALLAGALWIRPPLSPQAPMVVEAQADTRYRQGRRAVSDYLRTAYDGTPILASMSSLAHYMQESSAIGLHLANYIHEGNGDLWMDAFVAPRHHAGWILIEEQAEGGDLLAHRARDVPGFLDGFTRVMESSGLAVYRRGQ